MNVVWLVQANGIEDEGEIYFVCPTKELAISKTLEQLEDDLLEKDEFDDEPPDQTVNEDQSVTISYDDYMSYRIFPMPVTTE